MTSNVFWRAVLIAVVSVALTVPARAESITTAGNQILAGIIVVSVAAGVLVTVLVLHYKHKKLAITGCVISAQNGLSLTDEKDKRIYILSGDALGIKPGDRMTLEGSRTSQKKNPVFDAKRVIMDFGVCQP
ncbi:MAG TPA: hypothetical protein VK686_06810 [Bryobacteraceae bacterium]|jgi:hypothetical protein|nr:hypothetical protein [Bryobacteraceae bacterium]